MQNFIKRPVWLYAFIACVMTSPAIASTADSSGENAGTGFGMEAAASTLRNGVEQHEHTYTQEWAVVGADMLEQMRGGFSVESGLQVSFGIDRTVSINGDVVSSTSFNLQDPSKFVSGQANIAALDGGTVRLIQNGLGNNFELGKIPNGTAATFIQNSLNDQTIQSMTVINATSNSLDLLKGMNIQSTLHDALINSVSVR
jgi:hypothetical protein